MKDNQNKLLIEAARSFASSGTWHRPVITRVEMKRTMDSFGSGSDSVKAQT
jgi:hypothetical protein